MAENIFIIGNGFDIDLGFPTRYSDFAQSNFWPFKDRSTGIGGYLQSELKANDYKWIDVEQTIADYAKKFPLEKGNEFDMTLASVNRTIEDERKDFELLTNRLTDYLNDIWTNTQKNIKTDSIAFKLLQSIKNNPYDNHIFTFNYTQLSSLLQYLSNNGRIPEVEYIHGSLANDDIILGIGEDININKDFCFLYKQFNPHIKPHKILEKLMSAKNIIFFGHSLGGCDIQYFSDFFKFQSRVGFLPQDSKKIIFFTYDDKSIMDLNWNLRNATENRLTALRSNNDLVFVKTTDLNSKSFENVIRMLELSNLKGMCMPLLH